MTAAATAVRAKVGRSLMAAYIRLQPNGKIIFGLQVPGDPKGVDDWVWQGGRSAARSRG